jgi:hypothetical protein
MRQLANPRTLFLATVAKKGRKHYGDASPTLSAPGALLLVAKSWAHTVAPAPAPDSTFAQPPAAQQQFPNATTSAQINAPTEAAWRGFAAGLGHVAAHRADVGTPPSPHSPHQPLPVLSPTAIFPASRVAAPDEPLGGSEPSLAEPRSSTAGADHPRPSNRTGSPAFLPTNYPATFIRPKPAAYTAAAGTAAAAAVSTTASVTSSPAPSVRPGAGAYNEPRDGAFSGRIVQHDGSRAVHLLVSGTGARDYNLRMVRCHAKDELRFTASPASAAMPSPTPGGPSAGMARREDVSFGTFLYR